MANNKYYVSLPTQAPQHSRSGSRRPPLTPSTVSSPCLTTHAPVATRRDSGSGSPTKASALLAKVASHPTSPKGETPVSSPIASSRPTETHSSPLYTPERPAVWRSESARYVRQYKKQDGYISFPDFEKFCATQNPYESQHREHTAVKT
ncbi:uncharacterized protein BDR25DRAFT_216502 [Lindgomyces ingoldianus]|uniref:Uncharacterized protein n=1 Tax=Lindgomyces ingoldianus TaxID=673940 RepID=A0ACB6R527_9PLEO|nr:uncharacterized protein BDR25DRAFT_216502 [Lindgomyces ingoldianus]KAF2474359.1 hypothetical protein BDR25DRAFT_216502 [Lindgomyces ingoldianus]